MPLFASEENPSIDSGDGAAGGRWWKVYATAKKKSTNDRE